MVQAATRPELNVSPRQVLGKKVRGLRRQGIIPANVYGRGLESRAIQAPAEDLLRLLKTVGRNDVIYLKVAGEDGPRPALVRHIQRNPITDQILHVDFYQISLTERLRLDVPLVLAGTAPAVSTYGGILLQSLEHITVEGLPADIPSHIEVDVSGLEEIDAAIHVSDLRLPPNLTIITDPELVIAKVAAPAVERVEEVVEAVAEEAVPAEEAAEAVEAEGKEEEAREGGEET